MGHGGHAAGISSGVGSSLAKQLIDSYSVEVADGRAMNKDEVYKEMAKAGGVGDFANEEWFEERGITDPNQQQEILKEAKAMLPSKSSRVPHQVAEETLILLGDWRYHIYEADLADKSKETMGDVYEDVKRFREFARNYLQDRGLSPSRQKEVLDYAESKLNSDWRNKPYRYLTEFKTPDQIANEIMNAWKENRLDAIRKAVDAGEIVDGDKLYKDEAAFDEFVKKYFEDNKLKSKKALRNHVRHLLSGDWKERPGNIRPPGDRRIVASGQIGRIKWASMAGGDDDSSLGTGGAGNIEPTSYADMVKVFGEPDHRVSGDFKVTQEWTIAFSDGVVATIYDFDDRDSFGKDFEPGVNVRTPYVWHLGGNDDRVRERISEILGKRVETMDNTPWGEWFPRRK